MTYTPANFEVATSNSSGGDVLTKKKHYLTFDLYPKVTRNITQYLLHHVVDASAKFKVATTNDLGINTITRNVTDVRTFLRTDGRTDRRTEGRRTDFGTKLMYPNFLTKKAGIAKC